LVGAEVLTAARAALSAEIPRRRGGGVIVLLVVSALAVLLELWGCVTPFVPHTFWGMGFSLRDGVIFHVYPGEASSAALRYGDRVLGLPSGSVLRGYRLAHPLTGDTLRVSTRRGIVTVAAEPQTYLIGSAITALLNSAASAIIIALAALLMLRRPAWMAVAFWFYAMAGVFNADLSVELRWLPQSIALPCFQR